MDDMEINYQIQPQGDPTDQSVPLPGYPQISNESGGYVFEVSDIDKLKRFLYLGSELGYYKANSIHRKFSRSEVQAIDRYISLLKLSTKDISVKIIS